MLEVEDECVQLGSNQECGMEGSSKSVSSDDESLSTNDDDEDEPGGQGRGASCGKSLRNRKFRLPMSERQRQKRVVLQAMVRPLKRWLIRHRRHPYPTRSQKCELAVSAHMTLVQVSNWFANARRRLKSVVSEEDCSWEQRVRLYNSCLSGNAERLSISSDDSVWDSSQDENMGQESNMLTDDDSDVEDKPEQHQQAFVMDHSYFASAPPALQPEDSSTSSSCSSSSDSEKLTSFPPTPPESPQKYRHRYQSEGENGNNDGKCWFDFMSSADSTMKRKQPWSDDEQSCLMKRRLVLWAAASERTALDEVPRQRQWEELDAALALTCLSGTQVDCTF